MGRPWSVCAVTLALILTPAQTSATPAADARLIAPDRPGTTRVGDRLLFDVVVRGGGQRQDRFSLAVVAAGLQPGAPVPATVVAPPGTKARVPRAAPETMKGVWIAERPPREWLLVRVDALGSGETVRESAFSFVPAELLAGGFYDMATAMLSPNDSPDAGRVLIEERLKHGLESVLALTSVLSGNEQLKPVFRTLGRQTLRKPGVGTRLSAMFGAEIRVVYSVNADRVRPIEPRWPVADGESAYEVAVDVQAQEEALGRITLAVVRSRAPYSLTAGIVGVSGAHPDDPGASFEVRLSASSSDGRR
jgi:hypothetical protein